jgi:peptide-methionine (S)-S-oxide reductase
MPNILQSNCAILFELKLLRSINLNETEGIEVATLGGGCFWCTEAIFSEIEGVKQVVSGYSGGSLVNPSYEQVSTGATGHTEVVQAHFNPAVISFREILCIFFATHDPTTMNRQGADVGTQYRSVVFYHNRKQKDIAEQVINELESESVYDSPIVTAVEPFTTFYRAEEYHRGYFMRHPALPYCRAVISPKVTKLRKKMFDKLKKH